MTEKTIWGAKTLASSPDSDDLNARRIYHYIRNQTQVLIEDMLGDDASKTVTPEELRAAISSSMTTVIERLIQNGAIEKPEFDIEVDATGDVMNTVIVPKNAAAMEFMRGKFRG